MIGAEPGITLENIFMCPVGTSVAETMGHFSKCMVLPILLLDQKGTLAIGTMGQFKFSCAICLRAHPQVIPGKYVE